MTTPDNEALIDDSLTRHLYKLASSLSAVSLHKYMFSSAERKARALGCDITTLTMLFYKALAEIDSGPGLSIEEKILQCLKKAEGQSMSLGEITAECGFSKIHTQNTLKELFERGLIARDQLKIVGRPYAYSTTSVGDIIASGGVDNASPKARQDYNDAFKQYCNTLVASPSNNGIKADELYLASVGGNKEPLDEAIARFQMDVQEQLDKAIEKIRNTGGTDL